MMGIIGKKIGMTQIFDEKGDVLPVTVIEAGPCTVTEVRTPARDGYVAVQLGFGTNKESRFAKPVLGQFKKRNLVPARHLREFRIEDASEYEVGKTVQASLFTKGEYVDVEGVTKGRGFQGVVKRYGFHGGPNTHGNTKHRRPGSIGPGTDPSRVIKGKKMPGHYGDHQHTQTHLRVERIDTERNLIYIRGSIAGPTNGIVMVKKQG
jgi:large subunit ribosomal protein L3